MSRKLQEFAVRITVLRKLFHQDLVDKYAAHPERWGPCACFEEGAEFVTAKDKPWEMPEGFCGWAWADIQKLVYGMARGGQEVFVTCCTDGYRPVVFKLEKLRDAEASAHPRKPTPE